MLACRPAFLKLQKRISPTELQPCWRACSLGLPSTKTVPYLSGGGEKTPTRNDNGEGIDVNKQPQPRVKMAVS